MSKLPKLIADSREPEVVTRLKAKLPAPRLVVKQITSGDFVICRSPTSKLPRIAACIERKTWRDFAQGFIDGRYKNLRKLLKLRNQTGCMIIFIIEGPAFPDPKRKIGRIPVQSTLTALRHLAVRHGIPYFHTKDTDHTSTVLIQLLADYSEIDNTYTYDIAHDADDAAGAADAADATDATDVPEVLTSREIEPDSEIAAKMWAGLKGISIAIGNVFTTQFSMSDFIRGKAGVRVCDLKNAGGRSVNKHGKASLNSLLRGDKNADMRIMMGIKGIGKVTATHLLENKTLKQICSYSPATLAIAQVSKGKLGLKKATLVLRILNFSNRAEDVAKKGEKLLKTAKRVAVDHENFVMSKADVARCLEMFE